MGDRPSVTGAAEALAVLGVDSVAGLPVASVAKSIADMFTAHRARKFTDALDAIVSEAIRLEEVGGRTPEQARQQVGALLAKLDDDNQTVFCEAMEAMLRSIDSAAYRYISILTLDYLRLSKPVDSFYRRVVRMLESADQEEIGQLEELFAACDDFVRSRSEFKGLAVIFFTGTHSTVIHDASTPVRDENHKRNYGIVPSRAILCLKSARLHSAASGQGGMDSTPGLVFRASDLPLLRQLISLFTPANQ